MEKHTNVPEAAIWNAEKSEWEMGEMNAAGNKTGIWNHWHEKGHVCNIIDYGNGNPPFLFKRFHPDGTLAQQGNWYGGDTFLGTFRWIKSENRTDTRFVKGSAAKSANVWIAEYDYIAKNIYSTQRFFDKENKPVNSMGEPLPKRPASVPELAHHESKKLRSDRTDCWVMCTIDGIKGKYINDYTEWDLKGRLITKHVYDAATYELKETYKYDKGQLSALIIHTKDGSITDLYHNGINPPALSQKILRKGQENIHLTFFDAAGKRLYSVCTEEVTGLHSKRYYNEALVFECIQSPDVTKAPVSVRYYYRLGTWMIDYTSNGDGTGVWKYYSEDGEVMYSLPEAYEESRNEYKNWDRFMPDWLDYEETSPTDYDAITDAFVEKHNMEGLGKLEIPPHLEKELKKINWEDVETAMGDSTKLPGYINGLLVEDEKVAVACLHRIWREIEHQETVYDATYKVAIILARMIPFYAAHEVTRQRLFTFLEEVLDLPNIKYDKKQYKELVTALQSNAPSLLEGR